MSSKSGAANPVTASGQIVYFPAKGHVAIKGAQMPGSIVPLSVLKYSRFVGDGMPTTPKLHMVGSIIHDMMN